MTETQTIARHIGAACIGAAFVSLDVGFGRAVIAAVLLVAAMELYAWSVVRDAVKGEA
jgi:hypothetical protein